MNRPMSMSSMAAKFGTVATGEHKNHQSDESSSEEVQQTTRNSTIEVETTRNSTIEEITSSRNNNTSTSSTSSSSSVPAGSSALVQQLLVTKSYNFGTANQNQGSKSTPRLLVPAKSLSSGNKVRYNIGSSIDTKTSSETNSTVFNSGYKKQKTNHGRDHDTPLPQSLYTQRLDSILANILESIPHDIDQVIR